MSKNPSSRLIFVAGTAYSGTTMLELMLANRSEGFACGETFAYFRPYRPNHHHPICSCFDPECRLWSRFKIEGEKEFYGEIDRRFPNVEFITDSGSPSWIGDQLRYQSRIRRDLVIIFKHPWSWLHSAASKKKPESPGNYLQVYSQLLRHSIHADRVHFVNCHRLTQQPEIQLSRLCQRLKMNYRPGQERFWESIHHILFGSLSARYHLAEPDSSSFHRIRHRIEALRRGKPTVLDHHHEIYSSTAPTDENLPVFLRDHPVLDLYKSLDELSRTDQTKQPWHKLCQRILGKQKGDGRNEWAIQTVINLCIFRKRFSDKGLQDAEKFLANEGWMDRASARRILAAEWCRQGELIRAWDLYMENMKHPKFNRHYPADGYRLLRLSLKRALS